MHHIVKYILSTEKDESKYNQSLSKFKGITCKPDKNKGFEELVDASFAGDWNNLCSEELSSVMSRTGFVIKHVSFPIYWTSKLQTEIVLSTTESEYIALSHLMREVIPLLPLVEEIHEVLDMQNPSKTCTSKCTVFEDKTVALNLRNVQDCVQEPNILELNIIVLGVRLLTEQSKCCLLTLKINKQTYLQNHYPEINFKNCVNSLLDGKAY